jgi:hypothetical protein
MISLSLSLSLSLDLSFFLDLSYSYVPFFDAYFDAFLSKRNEIHTKKQTVAAGLILSDKDSSQ